MPLRIELFEPMPKSRAAKKQRIMNLQQQAGMLNPMMMNPLLLQNMMMNPMNQMLMPNAMMNPENQAADSSESGDDGPAPPKASSAAGSAGDALALPAAEGAHVGFAQRALQVLADRRAELYRSTGAPDRALPRNATLLRALPKAMGSKIQLRVDFVCLFVWTHVT